MRQALIDGWVWENLAEHPTENWRARNPKWTVLGAYRTEMGMEEKPVVTANALDADVALARLRRLVESYENGVTLT